MPYPAKLLNPDESVALDLNPHWWYFAESVSSFTVSGIFWLFVFGKYQDSRFSNNMGYRCFIGIAYL